MYIACKLQSVLSQAAARILSFTKGCEIFFFKKGQNEKKMIHVVYR